MNVMEHLYCEEVLQKPSKHVRSIRDNIHGLVNILTETEDKIINSRIFQRLRDVTQLGHVKVLFPTANHTRFEHCVGAMEICGKFATHLVSNWKNRENAQKFVRFCRLLALLHDLGHFPMSHCTEDTLYSTFRSTKRKREAEDNECEKKIKSHDLYLRNFLLRENHELNIIFDLDEDGFTCAQLAEAYGSKLFSAIVKVADRSDYIKRDAKNTGLDHYSTVDIQRIVNHSWLERDEKGDVKLVHDDSLSVEQKQFDHSRTFLYENVYRKRRVIEYDKALLRLLNSAMKSKPNLFDSFILDADHFAKFTETTFFSILEYECTLNGTLEQFNRYRNYELPKDGEK